ncbi:uncharacterized protein LOC124519700 [Lynx rufus]|uniref:uncharacterized protein LOC124519700 n=1 Tax=Lynx rufus TaxID=61384 RepID=UPI001F12801A|nr:uncharacterized protein LOC124519700 [Lynx rufus]
MTGGYLAARRLTCFVRINRFTGSNDQVSWGAVACSFLELEKMKPALLEEGVLPIPLGAEKGRCQTVPYLCHFISLFLAAGAPASWLRPQHSPPVSQAAQAAHRVGLLKQQTLISPSLEAVTSKVKVLADSVSADATRCSQAPGGYRCCWFRDHARRTTPSEHEVVPQSLFPGAVAVRAGGNPLEAEVPVKWAPATPMSGSSLRRDGRRGPWARLPVDSARSAPWSWTGLPLAQGPSRPLRRRTEGEPTAHVQAWSPGATWTITELPAIRTPGRGHSVGLGIKEPPGQESRANREVEPGLSPKDGTRERDRGVEDAPPPSF